MATFQPRNRVIRNRVIKLEVLLEGRKIRKIEIDIDIENIQRKVTQRNRIVAYIETQTFKFNT